MSASAGLQQKRFIHRTAIGSLLAFDTAFVFAIVAIIVSSSVYDRNSPPHATPFHRQWGGGRAGL